MTQTEQDEQKKIVEKFQSLREEQQELASEITRILEEKREYSRVLELLREIDGDQTAFRLVNDSLVEYKVNEVIPSLEDNLKKLDQVNEELNKKLVDKGNELNDHKTKHNIRLLTEEESRKIREAQMKQFQEQSQKTQKTSA